MCNKIIEATSTVLKKKLGIYQTLCTGSQDCSEYVGTDLKKTGKCYFTIAKEDFTFAMAGIILPKNSPYTKEMSKS